MRKLHLVGLTTDRDGLIFTARKGSKSGGYIVPLDDKVLAAIAQASGALNGGELEEHVAVVDATVVPKRLRSESALTPREMQARLRSGRSIEEVAAEAGVDNEWVARFAVPILAEQAQVVELARGLVYAKPRLGESTQSLGMSVLQNLSDRGVFLPDDVVNAGWSAFQLHDSVWMVRFRYHSRGREQEAQWEIDVPTGRLRARNRQASDLGYVAPERWRAGVEVDEALPDEEVTEPEPTAKAVAGAKRATSSRAAGTRRTTTAKRRPAVKPATPARTAKAVKAGKAAKAVKAVKAGKATKAVKTTKTTKAVTAPTAAKTIRGAKAVSAAKAKSTKAAPVRTTARAGRSAAAKSVPAVAKTSPRTASAKSPTKRRTAKAVPAPESGPTAGSGGVRMAVAQVSTARVKASMEAAEREPWAAVVRRPQRTQQRSLDGVSARSDGGGPTSRDQSSDAGRGARRNEPAAVGAFEPRPLPPAGQEPPPPPRVRKVTLPRPRRADDAPAVSLPAPRPPAARQEPVPVERVKRRRLRSR